MTVLPGATLSSFLIHESTGLVGTLTWRLVDSAGTVVIAATTAGITEGPSGTYRHDYAAPLTAGLYQPLWNDGTADLPDEPIVVGVAQLPFSQVTLTANYNTADGSPAAGTVTFTLTEPISNGGVTLPPSPIVATLDAGGGLEVVLAATDDTDTVPQGVLYGVTEQITGGQPRDYFVAVPSTFSAVDLAVLMPTGARWE